MQTNISFKRECSLAGACSLPPVDENGTGAKTIPTKPDFLILKNTNDEFETACKTSEIATISKGSDDGKHFLYFLDKMGNSVGRILDSGEKLTDVASKLGTVLDLTV